MFMKFSFPTCMTNQQQALYLLLEEVIKEGVQVSLLQLYTGAVQLQSMYRSTRVSLLCVHKHSKLKA